MLHTKSQTPQIFCHSQFSSDNSCHGLNIVISHKVGLRDWHTFGLCLVQGLVTLHS